MMSLYFFNLRRWHLTVRDGHGEVLPGPAEAVEHAARAILDLVGQKGCCRDWAGWSVEIEDEARGRVATVPFGFARTAVPLPR